MTSNGGGHRHQHHRGCFKRRKLTSLENTYSQVFRELRQNPRSRDPHRQPNGQKS